MNNTDLKKEFDLFLMRSEFISENSKLFVLKIRNMGNIQNLKRAFADLVCIENEYNRLFRNDIKKLMAEFADGKLVSWTILNLTRNLS